MCLWVINCTALDATLPGQWESPGGPELPPAAQAIRAGAGGAQGLAVWGAGAESSSALPAPLPSLLVCGVDRVPAAPSAGSAELRVSVGPRRARRWFLKLHNSPNETSTKP